MIWPRCVCRFDRLKRRREGSNILRLFFFSLCVLYYQHNQTDDESKNVPFSLAAKEKRRREKKREEKIVTRRKRRQRRTREKEEESSARENGWSFSCCSSREKRGDTKMNFPSYSQSIDTPSSCYSSSSSSTPLTDFVSFGQRRSRLSYSSMSPGRRRRYQRQRCNDDVS